MDLLCEVDYARPHDFGRGKGKYETDYEIEEVKEYAVEMMRARGKVKDDAQNV